ncbi:MAG: pseudouridylate synthase [Nocardiaceae bacterium]|nr:pseudouridylate synthase [Nocardiaceae bacterium]
MRRCTRPPLPRRHGLEPACIRMPADGTWPTVRSFLIDRLADHVPAPRVAQMMDNAEVVDADGPIPPDAPYVPMGRVWFHRDLPNETFVPFEIGIVHRDSQILVADKPHFMATIPRGRHILQTALVRLRHSLDLPDLTPAHRLDRATAGLVMFVVDPTCRGAYQSLFERHRIVKHYEAVAPVAPELSFPRRVRTHIVKRPGSLAAFEAPGEPNSDTYIALLDQRGDLGRYRLTPRTGKTHQLRLHMHGLGVPIVGDDFYPTFDPRPLDDFTNPLQLLATHLEFTDPLTGVPRVFTSRLALSAWS